MFHAYPDIQGKCNRRPCPCNFINQLDPVMIKIWVNTTGDCWRWEKKGNFWQILEYLAACRWLDYWEWHVIWRNQLKYVLFKQSSAITLNSGPEHWSNLVLFHPIGALTQVFRIRVLKDVVLIRCVYMLLDDFSLTESRFPTTVNAFNISILE